MMFCINGKLFPILKNMGFDFDNKTMEFVFDETESQTLTEQWSIVEKALNYYELDPLELMKIFNLPIIGKKEQNQNPLSGFSANFR